MKFHPTNGVSRWLLRNNSDAETGSNAGSNLELISRTDAGGFGQTAFRVNRASGSVDFPISPTVPTPTTSTQATPKSYVDGLSSNYAKLSGGNSFTSGNQNYAAGINSVFANGYVMSSNTSLYPGITGRLDGPTVVASNGNALGLAANSDNLSVFLGSKDAIIFGSSAAGTTTSSSITMQGPIISRSTDGAALLWSADGSLVRAARVTASGTGSATTITVAHGLSGISSASIATVSAINAASSGISYVTCDATNIYIVYTTAPVSGTNNLSYNVIIKP